MKNIYLVDKDDVFKLKLEELFKSDKEIKIKRIAPDEVETMFDDIPDLIVIDEDALQDMDDIIAIADDIRKNEENSITPIIVMSSIQDDKHVVDVLKAAVDLYIKKPFDEKILYYSITNMVRLLNSNRTVSPLTGLPGNAQIQAEMKKRLKSGRTFAMLYVDLDNFKAYNDTYGFANGDEIIKFTARTIVKNILGEPEDVNNFVGHIGGDDFVAITEGVDYESKCQSMIADFDSESINYYNQEDIDNGYIEVENRKGVMEQFPLISVSIGVVEVNNEKFKNTLEIGEAGAAVKHLAKTIYGSTYVIDRRKQRDELFDRAANRKIQRNNKK